MDDRHKRLAAAKRKLQEYKSQKKHENVNDSLDSSSRKSSENDNDADTSKDGTHSEEVELSLSTSVESGEAESTVENPGTEAVPNEIRTADSTVGDTVENGQELNTSEQKSTTEPESLVRIEENSSHVEVTERVEITLNEASTQCEQELEMMQTQSDVLENLEKELTSLRKENSLLTHRETELLLQLETSEKLIRDLRKEVNQFKQHGNVHQQLEDLQEAVGIVTKSKMNLAEQLSNEQDKNKELLNNVETFENELQSLRKENTKLWGDLNTLKAKLEEEVMKNQVLEDQRRLFSTQMETLQKKLSSLEVSKAPTCSHEHGNQKVIEDGHAHSHGGGASHGHHGESLSNGHSDSHSDHGHHDHHDHDHHDHDHHDHGSDDGHQHGDHHAGGENKSLVEMQKTLKRLEWENKTYEAELTKLGPLKNLGPKCEELQSQNAALKQEIDRLEHLVIQLQGENDTIGDYIQLYQTQRLALRQHAKENDDLVEALSREKNELLHKLSELNHAVEKLASQPNASVLENKIRDLIVDVNTKVHETYSCSVCSGSRLMTV